jgi:hypothetical protein
MTKALILGLLLTLPAFAAPAVVQQTPDAAWNNQGDPATVDFPSNVTAGNSVICAIGAFHGSGYTYTSVRDENDANTLSVVNDSSSGDADSGTAAPFTRAIVLAVHNVGGTAFNGMEVNGHANNNYGAWKCWEVSGLAATPNDRACSVQDVFPQAADANCAIGTLSQAEEFVVAVMVIFEDVDNNLNITGPTGGPSWTNDDINQDSTTRPGYSFDRGVTSATTGFTVQYSHDDLVSGVDHSIAMATFEAAASSTAAVLRQREYYQ